MDNLQYLHNTLLEHNMLDKSFEEFQAASSDKSYQQKVFQEASARGMFPGSWVDFQNKYFPTQAATTTPTSTSTSTKPYVAPVTETKEKSEEDLLIEQDAVNKEFWGKTGERYKREYFSKNEDDKWVYTDPKSGKVSVMEDIVSSTSKVSKLISKPLQEMLSELQDEDLRIGQQTKGGTYGDVEERVAITSDDVWEGEKGTKEHKAWVKKKQEQAGQMREDQKVERKVKQETKQEIISDEEELDLVFEPYMPEQLEGYLTNLMESSPSSYDDFTEKYGFANASEKNWNNKEKKIGQRVVFGDDEEYLVNVSYKEQNLGPFTKTTKSWVSEDVYDMFPQREEVSYINNQTGEELTEEEIKEFDKFSTMKELNDDMLEMIDKGLSDDNKKLLYKNPELFLSNDKYRARTERPEGSISVLETLMDKEEDKEITETYEHGGYYTDDHVVMTKEFPFFKSVKRGDKRQSDEVIDYYETSDGRVFQKVDTDGDGTPDTNVYTDWIEGTPSRVKKEYKDIKAELDPLQELYWQIEEGNRSRFDEYKKLGIKDDDDLIQRWEKANSKFGDFLPTYTQYHKESRNLDAADYYGQAELERKKDQNIKLKETQTEAKLYFEKESKVIKEEIVEELNLEVQNRFQRNEKNEIIDKSTNEVVSEEYIEDWYKKQFDQKFRKHPDIIRLHKENKALFSNTMNEYREEYKPTYELMGVDVYNDIANQLNNTGFNNFSAPEKVSAIKNIWRQMESDIISKYEGDIKDLDSYILQRKHEFMSYFYGDDKFGLGKTTDKEGNKVTSQYSIVEMTENVRANAMEDLEKQISKTEIGGYNVEAKEKVEELQKIVEMTGDILEKSSLTEDEVDGFWKGFGSLDDVAYVPFVSGVVDMVDAAENLGKMSDISDKLQKGEALTQDEQTFMALYQFQGMTEERVKEMSSWTYGGGALTAQMIPYVIEFIATGGAFTAAKTGTKKLIIKKLKNVTEESLEKSLKQRLAVNGLSWFAGTLGHTAANPQRYLAETFKNMTPEMETALGPAGDEILDLLDGDSPDNSTESGKYEFTTRVTDEGDDFAMAFLRGFGVTWAEFATERIGEAVPMFGKFLGDKTVMGREVKEFLKRSIIGRYMTKTGLSKDQVVARFMSEKMGWNGFIGEVFEEVVNQPISNLMTGEDLFAGMDSRFFGELSISMGSTQLAFGGLGIGVNLIRGKYKGGFVINDRVYTESAFKKEIERLESMNLLGSSTYPVDIKVNNKESVYNWVQEKLKKHKESSTVKTGKNKGKSSNTSKFTEVNNFDRTLAHEIDIINDLDGETYAELEANEQEQSELLRQKEDIKTNPNLSEKERTKQLRDINNALKRVERHKVKLINPTLNRISKNKRRKAYENTTAKIKRLIEKAELDVNIIEKSTLDRTKKAAKADLERQIKENQKLLDKYEGKGSKRKNTKAYKQLLKIREELLLEVSGKDIMGKDSKDNDSKNPEDGYKKGFLNQIDDVTHGFISKDGKTIIINKNSALAKDSGNINVAAHEFLHRALKTMLDQNPAANLAMGRALQKYIMNIDPSYYGSEYRNRLMSYQGEIQNINNHYEAINNALEAGDKKAAQQIAEDLNRLETNLTVQNSQEAITLLSDAFANADVSMSNRNLRSLGKIFERVMSAFGSKAKFKEGGDVYDFIANFTESLEKDKFSSGLMKTLTTEANIAGELKEDVEGYGKALGRQSGVYKSKGETIYRVDGKDINLSELGEAQFSKSIDKTEQELGRSANTPAILKKNDELQQEILRRAKLDVNDPLYTGRDKKGKIIIPEDIREELVDNNLPRVTALAAQAANAGKNIELEQDKKKGFDQFFPEYYMKLYDLTRTYNPLVWNEKNKRFDEIPFGAYMNTILPLKYSGILEDLKKGEIENQVSEEEAKNIAAENEKKKEERGKLIKLYERFGDYAKMYNLKVRKAIEEGKFNPAQENISRIGVNTIDLFPQSTQLMFGVIPKEGNLTEGDIKAAQMFINKHPETIGAILPKYDKVTVRINKKTGKPSVVKSIGLPRKLLKLFYTKSEKKIGNDYRWTRNETIDINKLLKHVGITERGNPNLYKKGDNVSQSVIGLMNLVGRMMTNQASREYFLDNNMPLENMGVLQESIGTAMFSKGVSKGSLADRSIFYLNLPKFGENYKKHGRNVRKAFNMTYPPDIENPIFKGNRKAIIEDLERYIETYSEYATEATLGQQPVLTLENYINEQTMSLELEENLRKVIGLPKGSLDFKNKEQLENVRTAVSTLISEGNITPTEARRFMGFLYATGNIGGTTLIPNEQGDLITNEEHWQLKILKSTEQLEKAKALKDKNKIKTLEDRIAKYTMNIEQGIQVEPKMYGLFKGVEDFDTVVTEGIKDTGDKIPPNTKQDVTVKLETKEDKQAQEDSSMRNKMFLRKLRGELKRLMANGSITKNDAGMLLLAMGNVGMNTPIAAAAKVAYTTGGPITKASHRYEHLIPRKIVTLYYANSVMEGSTQSELEFDNLMDQFVVAIIPKEQDKIINDVGYQSAMPNSWFIGANPLQRYFNMRTFGKINLKLIDVKTGKPVAGYENFNKVHEINGDNHAKQVILNKAMLAGRVVTPARGMSTFDFDETVGVSDNYVIAKKEGETQKIPSDQWPFVGAQMMEEGWEMDFADFNQVTKGRPGPLMQKMKNQIKKYGPENVYILTARASESEQAIHEYLKSEGIEIPLENITGLGNSTGEAKAEWMLEKFAEGYNDMYFVDDALPNVEAVKNVLDQLDIKSNVQIARQQFSKGIKSEFAGIMNNANLDMNRILEQTKGVKAEAVFSAAQGKIRGKKIGKYKIFLPPSAQDFKGLLYQFLAKGRVGEAQMAFFEKALIKPFARAISEINSFKQGLNNKYKAALKEFGVNEDGFNITNLVGQTNFTEEQAVRVYLFNKAGYEIPGLSKRDLKTLIEFVEANENIRSFAETIGMASEQEAGYLEPSDYWMVENLRSDILKIANEKKRSDFLGEWKQNVEIMFSPANLNKIEAIYGSNFREALEDMLHRMEFGTSRESGGGRLVNTFNNWANQSVGAIMFLNMRSALLQTISSINYLNWSDNNPLKAGMALANVPQFIKDFAMIFNSDMLKQRRAGNQRGINEAELAEAVGGSNFSPRAILNWLLTKGFLPTQVADSFAISSGGATFYRNRVNTYLKEGYSQEEAEQMAFQDFQENTEESQQSSRPDMISQQQSSPLGRYILAFKNTPMQYARLIQKSAKDLAAGRGDAKTNMGKIVYYAAVQNLIFSALQTSLGMLIGTDEEEEDINKYERTINSMIDSLLGGLGLGGVAVSTLKNTIQEFLKQEDKGWNSDHTYTILRFFGLSPTVGSKGRKLYGAIQTWKYNKDVIKEMDVLDIDNPIYSIIGNLVSATTNLPLDRAVKKIDNIDAALTEDLSALQRLALLMGWNTWDLDVDDSDVVAVEDEIKEKKKIETEEKKKIKKEEKKIKVKEENKLKEEENKKKKDGGCIAIGKSGERCKNEAESGGYCTVHAKVEQGTKEVQCKKIKSDKKRCKMKTKAKSGYCYYHD